MGFVLQQPHREPTVENDLLQYDLCHGFCLNEWIHKLIQKKPIKFLKDLYEPRLGMKRHKMKGLLGPCRQEES